MSKDRVDDKDGRDLSGRSKKNLKLPEIKKPELPAALRNIKRQYLYIGAAVIAVLVILLVVLLAHKSDDTESKELVIVSAETGSVRHMSFPQLSLEEGEGKLSVTEFSQILNKLYEEDFVLIDVYDLAETQKDGTLRINSEISLPEGKKPLIISQRDVSYPIWNIGAGYAEKMVLDTAGNVKCVYTDASGDEHQGDYDLVPILETFIKEHPDFSYNGARGIIGVTGYNGVLGYRTSTYLTDAASNPWGLVYDVESEKASAAQVIDKLKKSGWHFACCGFNAISYGSENSIMTGDLDAWMAQVSDVIGGTDMIIYPMQTDVGSWAPYSETNSKYVYLRECGFRYFFINETETPWFIQCTNSYVRQAITEVNTYAQFEQALASA